MSHVSRIMQFSMRISDTMTSKTNSFVRQIRQRRYRYLTRSVPL